jgi:multiple sugar transport system substrate-binding protein
MPLLLKSPADTSTQPGATVSRRAVFGLASSVAVASLAAACAPGEGAGGTGAGAPSTAPATLRLGERATAEEQALNARLPAFAAKYPHIKVEREVITGDMIVALQAMAVSNTLPDNVHAYTGGQQYHTFALNGALRNIESFIARDKVDLKGWFPEMVEIMRVDGKLFGLPFKGQVLTAGFYYNVSLFEKAGVALPNDNWTLDDLVKAAQRLTVRQGTETTQWGYGLHTWGGENFTGHMRQWNGDSLSKDGKKATMDSPEVIEGLQWYEMMFQRERILRPITDASNDFLQGKIAIFGRTYFNYKSTILPSVGDPRTGKFKWDGAMMPKNAKTGKRGGIFAGDSHAVSRDSKAPDQAFELLKWLTDKEFGVALGSQTVGSTTLGGRPDVYADERILNHSSYTKQMQRAQLDSVTQIKEPSVVPYNFRASEVFGVRDTGVTKIADGAAKAEAGFLREVSREMQVLLDKPRP